MHVTQYTHTLHLIRGINAQVQEHYKIHYKNLNKQLHRLQSWHTTIKQWPRFNVIVSLVHCVALLSLLGCCYLLPRCLCDCASSCSLLCLVLNSVLTHSISNGKWLCGLLLHISRQQHTQHLLQSGVYLQPYCSGTSSRPTRAISILLLYVVYGRCHVITALITLSVHTNQQVGRVKSYGSATAAVICTSLLYISVVCATTECAFSVVAAMHWFTMLLAAVCSYRLLL
jgi:hypothetical protein